MKTIMGMMMAHNPELRQIALESVKNGNKIADTARVLGVPVRTVGHWVEDYRHPVKTGKKARSGEHPPCFTGEEWVDWTRLARGSWVPVRNFCCDCLPKYKERMMKQGKCSHHETLFIVEDHEVSGISCASKSYRNVIRFLAGDESRGPFTVIGGQNETAGNSEKERGEIGLSEWPLDR